jgi:hypothetical protein
MPNWFGMAASVIGRLPLERLLVKPRDPNESLERLRDMLSSADMQDKAPVSEKRGETPAAPPSKATEIPTGCVPCAIGHFGTCSGLLNEAMRFAHGDGIASGEVIDRVNMCMDELNAMERVDLRPEMIASLPRRQKKIAESALSESRQLRHRLEGIRTADELEQVAANTQTVRREIGRAWYQERLGNPEVSLEEAKKMAEEE